MKLVVVFLLISPVVYGASVEKCTWGESYWCSELNIAETCGALQHCKTTIWANQLLNSDNSDVCQFCQSIINDVQNFIGNEKTEAEITHYLSTACAIVPDTKASAECKAIVEKYGSSIIDLINSHVNPQMTCGLMHLCTGVKDVVKHSDSALIRVPLEKPASQSDVDVTEQKICTDCKAFFNDILQQIISNTTVTEVENLIDEQVCSQLGSYRQECNDLVKEILPVVMQYVQQFLNPEMLCQTAGFCTNTAGKSQTFIEFFKSSAVRNAFKEIGSIESCLVCKTIFSEIRTMIRTTDVQKSIKEFLKSDVCSRTGSLKDECVEVIDQFSSQAFEFLASVLDPETRCHSFSFCDASSSLESAAVVRQSTKTSVNAPSAECVLCEFVMKEVKTLIENNRTEAEILQALDKVCSILPSTIKSSCLDFVNTYGRAILTILETQVTPEEVCTILGLCKAKSEPTKVEFKGNDAETCLICETLIQYVEALVKENATVEEIDNVLKKACNFVPQDMKDGCDALINKYSNLILQYIIAKYDPKEVCTLIKLCTEVETVHMVKIMDSGDCKSGPSYWCASTRNAHQCDAVEHCNKYVWINKP